MNYAEIKKIVFQRFGEDTVLSTDDLALQPSMTVAVGELAEFCRFLHQDERLYFDHLACITGIDNGATAGTMEVIYNLTSIVYEHNLMVKVLIIRNKADEPIPCVPSLTQIWRTADWHEREVYDLLGIHFDNHPDLRRILMPADWQGYPLRRDYEPQETYHGIKVKYE